jgi:hypothetical protein
MKLSDELIDDYILGALSPSEKRDFERELEGDASARARVEEARLLLAMLGSSAPEVPSVRMWRHIKAEISAAPSPSFWNQLLDSLSRPRLRLGLGFVAAACLAVVGLQIVRKPVPMPESMSSPSPSSPMSVGAELARPISPPSPPQPQAAPRPAPAEKKMASRSDIHEPTEVERALADQDLDGVIATMLRQRQAASLSAAPRAMRSAPSAGAAMRTVAYSEEASAPSARMDVDFDSAPAASVSRVDANGFWDFKPAALALNRRDWNLATSELLAAMKRAPEASERAFASSTLQLLSQGGQPVVAKVGLADASTLNVQSAERWQVFVDNHVARYSGAVVARMPGLRSEGDELLLDMAFDRASFSPGTRFIRLSDDTRGKVTGAGGESIDQDEFRAPRGADYLLRANELRLK